MEVPNEKNWSSTSYNANCIAEANSLIVSTHDSGDRTNFSFQNYYSRINSAFDLLAEGGLNYTKNDFKKIAEVKTV